MKFLFLFFTLFAAASYVFGDEKIYDFTIIHSYESGTWTQEGTRGVKNAIAQIGVATKVREIIYDYTKVQSAKEKMIKIDKIIAELKRRLPDVIIIFDDEAAEALVGKLGELKKPIVLTGINKDIKDSSWYLKEGDPRRFFTGIWERYPFEQSLKMLKTIKPSVSKINILTSENETSRIVTGQIKEKFKSYSGTYNGISLEKVYFTSSWTEWKKVILSHNKSDRAFWILVPWNVNDENGKEVDLRVIGNYYRSHSHIPEIGIVNINDKLGFVASFSVGAEDLGFQAGELAINILKSKKEPRDLPFVFNKLIRFVINKKRADQLGISIPKAFLDFAKIEKRIPMNHFR